MFDRYTADARKVIFFARYEASRLGSPDITTDLLWLGLLRQNAKLIRRHAPHVTADRINARIDASIPPPNPDIPRVSMTVEMPLSPEATQAIAAATAQADSHGQKHITPEHLILALLQTPTNP